MLSWAQGYVVASAERASIRAADVPVTNLWSPTTLELLARSRTKSGWVFDPLDVESMQAWIDNYCRANSLKTLMEASRVLVAELVQRAVAGR